MPDLITNSASGHNTGSRSCFWKKDDFDEVEEPILFKLRPVMSDRGGTFFVDVRLQSLPYRKGNKNRRWN